MRNLLGIVTVVLASCALSPQERAKRIIDEGLRDEVKAVRIEAARGLRLLDPERSVDVLLGAVEDGEPEVKAAALLALIPYTRTSPHLQPVIVRMCTSENPSVRVAAYRNVAAGIDTVREDLLKRGVNDESPRVRQVAYAGLAEYGDDGVLQAGFQDVDPLVRITVAKALSEMGRVGMYEYIKEELKRLAPESLGPGIIMLAQAGDTSARSLLKALLRESTGELRVDVAEALLILDDEAGVSALAKAIQSRDPFVRIRAVDVLMKYDIPELYDYLIAAARDEYINVAIKAIEALSEHHAGNHRELFVEIMGAQNALLRVAAAAAYLRS
ncbi:MAG: hypothetical protein JSU64_04355 [candidate division WOR-3 bacterium]|nr:MAG: hypothetical protein JSU64_04355 [candidate division WOR-3 bacterium]